MSVSGNFSMRDVYNQFGNGTRPNPSTLQSYLTKIFGSWSVGDTLRKFDGYGRPILTNVSFTGQAEGWEITFSATFDTGNNDTYSSNPDHSTYFRIRYSEDGFYMDDNVIMLTSSGWDLKNTNGGLSRTFTMPKYSTQYDFRIDVYNMFVDDSVGDYLLYPETLNTSYSATTGAEPTPDDLLALSWNSASKSSTDITTSWNYGTSSTDTPQPDNYDIEVIWNGTTYIFTNVTVTHITQNVYQATVNDIDFGTIPNGASVTTKVIAQKSGYYDKSSSGSFIV